MAYQWTFNLPPQDFAVQPLQIMNVYNGPIYSQNHFWCPPPQAQQDCLPPYVQSYDPGCSCPQSYQQASVQQQPYYAHYYGRQPRRQQPTSHAIGNRPHQRVPVGPTQPYSQQYSVPSQRDPTQRTMSWYHDEPQRFHRTFLSADDQENIFEREERYESSKAELLELGPLTFDERSLYGDPPDSSDFITLCTTAERYWNQILSDRKLLRAAVGQHESPVATPTPSPSGAHDPRRVLVSTEGCTTTLGSPSGLTDGTINTTKIKRESDQMSEPDEQVPASKRPCSMIQPSHSSR